MNGYSKMRVVSTKKSRSIDFSDIFSHPQIHKPIITNPNLDLSFKTQFTKQTNNIKKKDTFANHDSTQEEEDDEYGVVGEKSDVILSRNCSVSSTKSQRFRAEKQDTTLQGVVKRAFSMRRSSSVSGGYCRIYDQCDPPLSSPTDDVHLNMQTGSKKKMRGKILKACKRFFRTLV